MIIGVIIEVIIIIVVVIIMIIVIMIGPVRPREQLPLLSHGAPLETAPAQESVAQGQQNGRRDPGVIVIVSVIVILVIVAVIVVVIIIIMILIVVVVVVVVVVVITGVGGGRRGQRGRGRGEGEGCSAGASGPHAREPDASARLAGAPLAAALPDVADDHQVDPASPCARGRDRGGCRQGAKPAARRVQRVQHRHLAGAAEGVECYT